MPADRARLDQDLAIMIVTAPVWIAYFVVLVVVGAVNDGRGW